MAPIEDGPQYFHSRHVSFTGARRSLFFHLTAAYVPAAQWAQAACPGDGWSWPLGHAAHASEPLDGAKLPATHLAHALLPGAAAKLPASQAVHLRDRAVKRSRQRQPWPHACNAEVVLYNGSGGGGGEGGEGGGVFVV